MIPFLDLKAENAQVQAEIEAAVLRVARSGRYILGPEVEAFEAEWAAYCGTTHCVGVSNASDGLAMLLMALGVGPGDEVIVPANTYIGTWLPVTRVGARVVPVDADPDTMNIDPRLIGAAITPRTRGIIAVHLYGRPADMAAIWQIADAAKLFVLEDAAQAHGATYHGHRAGNLGRAAAFSFYPTKNLGALGDAGAITTNDAVLADKVRRLRNYGGSGPVGKYDHQVRGLNARLDEMQAAVLRAKLPYLEGENRRRKIKAGAYLHQLSGSGLRLPSVVSGHVWHQFVIRARSAGERFDLRAELLEAGLHTEIHYAIPPHRTLAYADHYHPWAKLPETDSIAETAISLPMGINVDAIRVSEYVRDALAVHRQNQRRAHA